MSNIKKQLAGAAGIVVLGLVAWGLYAAYQPQRLPLQGQMDAQEVNVSSKVAGRVGELYVKLGQTVPKGHVLFQLTSPEVDAKVAQATAATQAAEAVAKKLTTARGPKKYAPPGPTGNGRKPAPRLPKPRLNASTICTSRA